MDKQKKMHEDDLAESDPTNIRIPHALMEKLKLIDRTITKKGKTGKIITNLEVNETRKRKRMEVFKQEAVSSLQEDTVWLPPDDLTQAVEAATDKQFVPVQNYKQAVTSQNSINQSAKNQIEGITKVPYNTAMSFKGMDNRKVMYDSTKDGILKSVGWSENTQIPDFWEAQRLWGM